MFLPLKMILLLCICVAMVAPVWAQALSPDLSEAGKQEYAARLTVQEKKLNELATTGEVTAQIFEQAELEANSAKLQMQNLQVELAALQHETQERNAALNEAEAEAQRLRKLPGVEESDSEAAHRAVAAEQKAQALKQEYKQNESQLVDLRQRLEQATIRMSLAQIWLDRVDMLYHERQTEGLENRARLEQQRWRDEANKLLSQLAAMHDDGSLEVAWQRYILEIQIQNAEERIALSQREVKLALHERNLENLRQILTVPERLTAKIVSELSDLAAATQEVQHLLGQKFDVLQRQYNALQKRLTDKSLPRHQQREVEKEVKNLTELLETRKTQLVRAAELAAGAARSSAEATELYTEQRRRALYERNPLPLTFAGWQELGRKLAMAPAKFVEQAHILIAVAWADFKQASANRWLIAGFLGILLFSSMSWGQAHLRRYLARTTPIMPTDENVEVETAVKSTMYTESFFYRSVRIMLNLMDMNLSGLAVAIGLILLVWILQPAQTTVLLVLSLVLVWLMIKIPIDLAWLLLAAPHITAAQRNRRLYQQLRWMLVLFGGLATLTLLVHLLDFPPEVRNFNDTVFMLFLVLTVWPALHLRNQSVIYLKNHFEGNRWIWVARLVTIFVILSLLTVGLLGVLGYINLGWGVAQQLSWFLLLLTIWLVLRGLLKDMVIFSKNFALQHSRHYGLLWTQDVIPLLQRLAQIALAVGVLFLLLRLNGWDTGGVVLGIWHHVLFSFSNTPITIGNLLLSSFALYFVFWFASWARQITYRWIYSAIADLGARHSLSVFTQYALLLIGGLITLRILGLDLTTFAVFAGALGVGLGFGLQNIANNFVSGLLLLAARPLRTGDIINAAGAEGEVTEIGMRSITIRTWDYREVIVPNSELISSPFTNWTRSNAILRTVLLLGVSYGSDLDKVQRILTNIIDTHPDILKDPEWKVLLEEFADSAVIFRVHYYVNLRDYSLLGVKSEVLFSIWNQFKQEGIEIPFPQRDIHIRSSAVNASFGDLTSSA